MHRKLKKSTFLFRGPNLIIVNSKKINRGYQDTKCSSTIKNNE